MTVLIVLTLISALALALAAAWVGIPMLQRLKIGQHVRDVGPQQHLSKAGTPTMGGVIFLAAAVLAGLVFIREWQGFAVLLVALAFAAIGFADDYLKVVLARPLGLKARYKLTGQVIVSLLFFLVIWREGVDLSLTVPGWGEIYLGMLYPLLMLLVLIGSVNAVNLSDGVDGLAAGLGIVTLVAGTVVALVQQQTGVALAAVGLIGALLGFLRFNPARVFMGDTGSLAIGGAVAAIAVLTGTELLLLLFGGVFVIETVSVIIQVLYFRATGGRRVFRMAPIHHHFELLGWSERRVCGWFWLTQSALAAVGLALWFLL